MKSNNNDPLHEFLNQFHALPKADFDLLQQSFKPKAFKKGSSIIIPGQIQKDILFVRRGVQMSYYETESKIHVIAFTYPPGPCALPDSFPFQKPSDYYLSCASDSEFNSLHFDDLQRLFDESQPIERLFRKITEVILAGVINRHAELHSTSIEERFKAFCQRSPHLLQLVPHKYIASYLGIDATNFSKLYNNIRF